MIIQMTRQITLSQSIRLTFLKILVYDDIVIVLVSVGAKFRADPSKFVVIDGKYFLFLYDLEAHAQQLGWQAIMKN